MPTTQIEATLPLSYAARRGGDIHVQLQLRDRSQLNEPARLRLRRTEGAAKTPDAEVAGVSDSSVVLANVPAGAVGNGNWRVEINDTPDGHFRPVRAFIVISDANPLALLLGDPAARPHNLPTAPQKTTRQVAHQLGKVADRALAELSPEKARSIRAWLRKTARRMMR